LINMETLHHSFPHLAGAAARLGLWLKNTEACRVAYLKIISPVENETYFRLRGTVTTVGRSPDCALQLLDDTVSRHHCKIIKSDGDYWVQETGPTNPVLLNSRPIARHRLEPGDRLALGNSRLILVEKPQTG